MVIVHCEIQKYMLVIYGTKTDDWLDTCIAAKKWLSPDSFAVSDDDTGGAEDEHLNLKSKTKIKVKLKQNVKINQDQTS